MHILHAAQSDVNYTSLSLAHNKRMGENMNRVIIGMMAIATTMSAPALAGPGDANLWVGVEDTRDGVLIDEATGEAWLTGICLKPLAPATKTGQIWVSRTVELVSIGRTDIVLDQTFTLDTNAVSPTLTVKSVDRGGEQIFPASVETACQASASCRALLDAPTC